jgi:ribonuclease-3
VVARPLSAQVRRLEQRLGHDFADRDLLDRALTHRSAASAHNERLEFLGDAVIELVVTEWLFGSLPRHSEGDLTRLRARIVRRESLAEYARELALGDALTLGSGELKSGGRHRDSILADGFEALLGALYLDAGFDACKRCLLSLVESRLGTIDQWSVGKDPKTRLQEWLQGRGLPLPDYRVLRTEGAEHAREFVVECRVASLADGVQGHGSSRRRAEQAAARMMLERLTQSDA